MLISSHQHRKLRRFIIAAIIAITVISGLVWFFVSKNIEANMLSLAKNNNHIVTSAISSDIQKLQQNIINKLKKIPAASEAITSNSYSSLLMILNESLNKFNLLEISLSDETGKIFFSTNIEDLTKNISSAEKIKIIRKEKSSSFNIKSQSEVELFNTPINHIVSFMTLYKDKTNNKVDVIVKVIKNNNYLMKEVAYVKHLMLAGMISGIIILLIILYYMAKYSDNLVNKYAKQIVTQSKSDPVTGLLNRHHFFRFVRQSVTKTMQQNGRSSLLLIDIDHFKELNAKYDHTFGDEVLKIIVQRLSRLLGPTDTLARTGDDEFSILVEQSNSNSGIKDFARKILDKINEPIQIDANYIHLTCSIGVSALNQDAKDMEELIQHADSALFNAKDFGRNNYQLYSRGGGTRHIKFYEKQYSLNKALEEHEYVLHIQPKVNCETGDIVGGETLLRWDNPDFGLIQPLEFLPALETSGLIHSVGKWVLEESCRICKHWEKMGFSDMSISVNVSALQFKKENFVNTVSEVLRKSELDGNMLEIELTETCLMDNVEQSLIILNALKALGVRITIDDFGTGYSSLNYLKRFPIDILKIDRSFVTNIDDRSEKDNAAIVTAIMALSHSLHLNVVAEGVERANELAYLNALGCKIIQGFLFSKPLPSDEFDALLANKGIMLERLEDIRTQLSS